MLCFKFTQPAFNDIPLILARNKHRLIEYGSFSFVVAISPFPFIFGAPPMTLHGQLRVIIIQSLKRIESKGKYVRLITEVLDHSFTSALTDRDHVERTSLLFTAVESQLSERQMCPQLILGAGCDARYVVMIVADPAV